MQQQFNNLKVLIFDTSLDGHHLEYLHHLYHAVENRDKEIIFCVPESFNEVNVHLKWNERSNIRFSFIDNKTCNDLKCKGRISYAYSASNLLLKKCRQEKPNKVFLISILQFLPILPILFIGRKEKISGIIYKIYLYCWKNYSLLEKIYEFSRFLSVKLSSNIYRIFVLNDNASARCLNIAWHDKKFITLPDPFQNKAENIKLVKPLLDSSKTKVLHFGGLTRRKGTMEILQAISMICEEKKAEQFQFVFAGKINDDIKDEFYKLYRLLKNECDIILMDKFCSYEELNELCRECDIILAPYQNVYSSSGVIAYAAKFHKPVVVPDDGLLGKLVKRYKLGLAIKDLSANAISKILTSGNKIPTDINLENEYIQRNSVENFDHTIFGNI